jgi:hypothetical protein
VSSDSIAKGIIDDIINTVVKTAEVDEQKTKYLQHFINKHDTIVSNIHFTCILHLLNDTCVKHNFKSAHVSNLFWSREYNSAKEICKYPSFSKVGGNYPLDLKIIWSSVISDKLHYHEVKNSNAMKCSHFPHHHQNYKFCKKKHGKSSNNLWAGKLKIADSKQKY